MNRESLTMISLVLVSIAVPGYSAREETANPSGGAWTFLPQIGFYRSLAANEGPYDWEGMEYGFAVQAPWRILVETGTAVVEGALPVPIGGKIHAVPFMLRLAETELRTFYETRLSPNVAFDQRTQEIQVPEFVYRYASEDSFGNNFRATAVSSGSFFATGSQCSNLLSIAPNTLLPPDVLSVGFTFEAWSTAWLLANEVLDEVPMLGGVPTELPGPATIFVGVTPLAERCVEDACPCPQEPPPRSRTYRFAQMGEIKWCTENREVWKAKIDVMAQEVEKAFSGDNPAKLVRVHDHCWRIIGGSASADQAKAYNCDAGITGGSNGCTFSGYVHFGNNRVCRSYMEDLRADLDHSQEVFGPFEDPAVAQVMHFHSLNGFDGTCDWDGQQVCGLGETEVFGENLHGFGGVEKRSLARAMPAPAPETIQLAWPCKPYVPTHEFGHNFDVDHDGEIHSCYTTETCGSVMMHGVTGIIRNYFTNDNKQTIGICILSKFCGPNEAW